MTWFAALCIMTDCSAPVDYTAGRPVGHGIWICIIYLSFLRWAGKRNGPSGLRVRSHINLVVAWKSWWKKKKNWQCRQRKGMPSWGKAHCLIFVCCVSGRKKRRKWEEKEENLIFLAAGLTAMQSLCFNTIYLNVEYMGDNTVCWMNSKTRAVFVKIIEIENEPK